MEYRVALGILGIVIECAGGFILINQRFAQRWNAAPPVEGPSAIVGGLVLIGSWLYYLNRAIKMNKNDD